jgi:hypothetical protein
MQSLMEDQGMNTIPKLKTVIAAGAVTAVLATTAFGQADNTNSRTAPRWVPDYSYAPDYSYRYSYPNYSYPNYAYAPRYNYNYNYSYESARRAYMDQAGRRWDAMSSIGQGPTPYERERAFGYPYADWSTPPNYPRRGSVGVTQDSNPDDYATGIYNPKQ